MRKALQKRTFARASNTYKFLLLLSSLLLLSLSCVTPNQGPPALTRRLAFRHLSPQPFSVKLNRFLAVYDFNGDGLDDLLVGGDHSGTTDKTPILVLLSQGNVRFQEATAQFFPDLPYAASPIVAMADFTGNGIMDFAIFDAGNMELGQHPSGGFTGGVPMLYLGQTDGTWVLSDGLERAIQTADPRYCWLECAGIIHLKHVAVGDITGNGLPDMYVESGGGHNNPNPHFMINLGNGQFELDGSNQRRSDLLIRGLTGQFRYASQLLVDINGNGLTDLVMGQLRRIDNRQEALASVVVFNDGTGQFNLENAIPLPYAQFNDGYTYVKAIAALDIDGDGLLDLVLSHERGNVIPDPDGVGNTGRYLQILIQRPEGFVDETELRLGSQERTLASRVAPYGSNYNAPRTLQVVDIDGDGSPDLFMAGAGPVGSHAPLIYLNDGAGNFVPYPAEQFTQDQWFGENAILIDVNGNGIFDIVHSDDTPGPDGQYGTADDRTQLITTLVRRR